ncbi:phosphoserine phosphatase SerB [Rhodosalinus halophilus]|uniref:Phosphoserine phosphatase n=1 Tax=Rhodosalinus halophilus TaxID=2259333 RepID=A0A365U9K0_9RHOB|nr:phosphoserine phosphatase SerB [Rhodosalinus halophilus]RBI85536.1 phosphoserine phosphatase SerB [Rhodosalinus halophilus]
MPTAVLLTDPASPSLDGALVESLRNAWGGGAAVWLAPGEAAEFPVPCAPSNADEVWRALQEQGVDLALVPDKGRKKRLLVADMDSTLIRQECIDELAEVAGVGAHVREITARAMNGELDFEGALTERVALLEGLDAGTIDRVLAERITHMPGAATLAATMRANGAHTLLVSGGFTAFAEPVAAALGFDEAQANVLEAEGMRLTGRVRPPILGRDAKVRALERTAARLGLEPADAIAVGDGANDLAMLARAGLGVALHAKPAVQREARIRVNHGDLTALLYLQGYRAEDFAAA